MARRRHARHTRRLPRQVRFLSPKSGLEEETGVDPVGAMRSHWSGSCQSGGYSGIGGGGAGIKLVESLANLSFRSNLDGLETG